MSVKVMTYVWDYSQQTGTHLLMMLAIADHANDAGECFPMVKRLAAKCRVSVRQAQYLIKALEDAGELLIERGTGRGNPSIYTVKGAPDFTLYRKGAADCTLHAERVQQIAPIKKRKGAIQRQKRVQSSAPALKNARGVLRDPSLEPSEKEKEYTHPLSPSARGAVADSFFSSAADKTRDTDYPPPFERWWQTYPAHNRVAKKDCAKTWGTKHLDPRIDEIIAHTAAMTHTKQWKEGKIPNSTKYLHEERYDTPPHEGAASSGTSDALLAQLLEIEREAIDRQASERKAHP